METHDRNRRNWLRLHYLLDHTKLEMRGMLLTVWRMLYGSFWETSPESLTFLRKLINKGTGNLAYNPLKRAVERADVRHWTLDTVMLVLRAMGNPWLSENFFELIETTTHVKNFVTFYPSKNIPKKIFMEKYVMLLQVVLTLGASLVDLIYEIEANVHSVESLRLPTVVCPKLLKLKNAANDFFRKGNYEKAIRLTFTGVEDDVFLKEDVKALFFSNCSAYFLKWAESSSGEDREFYAKEAANEAKRAITLWPVWSKPYFRLGRAYEMVKKYHKAVSAYDEALKLEPSSEETKQRRDVCLAIVKQQESVPQIAKDLELSSVTKLSGFVKERLKDPRCTLKVFRQKFKEAKKQKSLDPDLLDGYRFRFGWKTPVNLKRAAKHFREAACKGNAEAMYTLAMMTKNGEGVEKDCLLALAILKRLSKLPPFLGFGKPNHGVLEGIHMIGVMHEEGIGVTVSSKRAFKWYKRAADWGLEDSLYKVGCMYHAGLGVQPNSDLALSAWHKGISCGNNNCLIPLAKLLIAVGDFEGLDCLKGTITDEESMCPTELRKQFEKLFNSRNKKRSHSQAEIKLRKSLLRIFNPSSVMENIRGHREKLSKVAKGGSNSSAPVVKLSPPRRSIPDILGALSCFEALMFIDMTPETTVKTKVYDKSFVQVLVADDPIDDGNSVTVLLEDIHGQVTPGVFHYVDQGSWLKFGAKFFIVNPRMEKNASGNFAIRVDNPECIYLHDEDLSDLCRFCRKKKGRLTCTKCKGGYYCSQDCREQDVVLLKHSLVCGRNVVTK